MFEAVITKGADTTSQIIDIAPAPAGLETLTSAFWDRIHQELSQMTPPIMLPPAEPWPHPGPDPMPDFPDTETTKVTVPGFGAVEARLA